MTAPLRRVLMVDAEPQIHRLIALLLGDGYQVDGATTADQALALVHDTPYDVVLVDEGLDGPGTPPTPSGGFDLLRRLRRVAPDLSLILFSADARVEKAVEAMRSGAHDYLRKTVSSSELRSAVERAAERGNLAREVRRLRSEVERARGLGQLIGDSPPMKQLIALAERVAASDATVLIIGESGTGKELLSRTLHRLGPRAEKPFVAFDCSALAPSLLEAELFGHEKGAFTGAVKARRGLFREAHGGTIFLDEIGDIAPAVQNKLLRVLQEREIKPVGGDQVVAVDVRVVAATNKDLKALVGRGEFREDLYWRLAVVPIQVPPLRERREDIPTLSAYILARRAGAAKTGPGEAQRYPTRISPGAMARLCAYHWPGNIRELENVLSRAAILCDGETIRSEDLDLAGLSAHLPPATPAARPADTAPLEPGRTLKQMVEDAVRGVERQAILDALDRSGGSPTKAAGLLGMSRASIYNKLKEYGL
ncbi:MAG TPA: sigma-54 dependent transcriptional regulator [Kofleriaceae bacterium]|nr:sigma-54 dependent transcriptional regulator [Kofleriaceae bacterium]